MKLATIPAALALVAVAVSLRVITTAEPETVETRHPVLILAPDDRSRCGETYGVLNLETVRGSAKRRGYWNQDRSIPAAWRPTKDDYRGWDTGHCAAAAWFGNQQLQDVTFTYSNAMPENLAMNRGIGAQIEALIREEAEAPGQQVYFAVTPLWIPEGGELRFRVVGPHALWVPTHKGWSILIEKDGKPVLARAWIVPNVAPPKGAKPDDYRRPVNDHEYWRGRDFFDFAWLDREQVERLEAVR